MKECKQCKRTLDDECFRKTKSRSTGKYKTKTGSSTICKDCESMNMRAHKALQTGDEVALSKLREYYAWMESQGKPPITAAARRLMGYEPLSEGAGRENPLLVAMSTGVSDALAHADKVRNRAYSSFDEADKVHRQLTDQLKDAGLYEEINGLMDDWFMDE